MTPGSAYFKCPSEMRKDLKNAIEKSLARKEPGIEDLKAELLKPSPGI